MYERRSIASALAEAVSTTAREIRGAIKLCRSKRRTRNLVKNRSALYVEVGAGDKKGENGWLTIDLTENCDIYWDLRKGLPFQRDSVSVIYSSHFLEHLRFREAQAFLKECLRVL